jgi:hypothetical protein
MKKISLVLFFALFPMIFSFPGFAYVIGDVNADNKVDLTEAIHALQVASSVRTAATAGATINVPAQVPTIQQAIDAAAPGDIISVTAGAYTETLTIKNKVLTIRGAGSGATTINGVTSSDALTIDGSNGVIVSGVTIKGGKNGILASRGAVVDVADVVVQDTTERGILILESARARLKNVTVQRSGIGGILITLGSSIIFSGTVASNANIEDGISIVDSSSAFFYGATVTVNANGRFGINVANNAALLIDGSSVTVTNGLGNASNLGKGIQAYGSSSIHVQNSSTLLCENNGLDGIGVGSASSFYTDATSSLTVRTAKRWGINILSSSSLFLSGTALVEGNASYGASVSGSSNLHIQGTLTIQDNVDFGLRIYQGTVNVDTAAMLTVNGSTGMGIGIFLNNNSAAGVYGGLLVKNNTGTSGNGIGIYIVNGSQAYLSPTSPKAVAVQSNGTGINVSGGGVSGSGSIDITGNTTKDLNISFGSRVSLPTSSYSTIECSKSYTATAMGVSCP